jgi:oxaloacetate decarboxylase alpha subunit
MACFAQVGWKFLANRYNPNAFEPKPDPIAHAVSSMPAHDNGIETYTVNVDGKNFNVTVASGSVTLDIKPITVATNAPPLAVVAGSGATIEAPMSGNILKLMVEVGSVVNEGDVVVLMEAMKMETEVRSKFTGTVSAIHVKEGATISFGTVLVSL